MRTGKNDHLLFEKLILFLILIVSISFQPGLCAGIGPGKPEVFFSVHRGFYFSPQLLILSTNDPGAGIMYTTDGSAPDEANGKTFTTPIHISSTTVVRAVAIRAGVKGNVVTSSYLFPEDIIRQSGSPAGYPLVWGKYTDISGTAVADYEMDPEIVNHPEYKELMIPALLSVPTLSIATKKGYLFSNTVNPDSGGIYIYTGANGKTGDNWERPVSAELILPGSQDGFQVNCGMQIQGGAGRLAEKNPKHSFRLAFRDTLGPSKLRYPLFGEDAATVFNGIVLRASFGNTWRHWESAQRTRATHIQDIWAKDTQLGMGHFAAHSRFVHLYLNGIYWGLYNFSERIDDDFLETYLGGDKSEYDIIKDYNELMSGNKDAWDYLWKTVNGNISDNAVYQKLIGNNPDGTRNPGFPAYVDPLNLCDYMLINFYGGNNDWDHHNWVAGRNRINPGRGFQFFCWDTEKILENVNENYVSENNAQRPSGIFNRLMGNREFRMLFADQVNFHLSGKGLLTPEEASSRWLQRANEIDTALVAESARWGDYRKDVHSWQSGPYELYTVNRHWLTEKNRLLTTYFPERTNIVLKQLNSAGMLPLVTPPQFNQNGGIVSNSFSLTMSTGAGLIYYTTDGADPRLPGGKLNPAALPYLSPVKPGAITEVKARTRLGGEWSAVSSATFFNENYQTGGEENISENGTMLVFPNPVKESAWVRFSLPERGEVMVSVYRPDGSCLQKIPRGFMEPGEHLFYWAPEQLTSGMYILILSSGRWSIRQKIFIIN